MTDQHRKTPRANWLEYERGIYFITICTKNRIQFFGSINDGVMNLSEIGKIVERHLLLTSKVINNIDIPLYVIMPNHIHFIISVEPKPEEVYSVNPIDQRNPNPSLRANQMFQRHIPTLSKYINSFKGAVTKEARQKLSEFAWQQRYHDRIIRNINEANRISDYILNNVARWDEDCFNDCPQHSS